MSLELGTGMMRAFQDAGLELLHSGVLVVVARGGERVVATRPPPLVGSDPGTRHVTPGSLRRDGGQEPHLVEQQVADAIGRLDPELVAQHMAARLVLAARL